LKEQIISYSLFSPKNLHVKLRTWDPYNSNLRYWYNLPAIVAVNQIIYPDAHIVIYFSKEIKNNPLFQLLLDLSEAFTSFELFQIDLDYSNTEPTLWRFKPLFDKEAKLIISRDLDSLPNEQEIKATYYFIQNNNYAIQSIRTHTNHKWPITIILAGLSAFRPSEIGELDNLDFDTFYHANKSDIYGVDQKVIIELFTQNRDFTTNKFLDIAIQSRKQIVSKPLIPCISIDEKIYSKKIKLPNIPQKLLDLLNAATTWGGEPIDFRGSYFRKLLEIDDPTVQKLNSVIMNSSSEIQSFYKL